MFARFKVTATFTAHGLQVRHYSPTFAGWIAGYNLCRWSVTKVGGDWSKLYTVKEAVMLEDDEYFVYEPLEVMCEKRKIVFTPSHFATRNTRGEMKVSTVLNDESADTPHECILLPNGQIEQVHVPVLCG